MPLKELPTDPEFIYRFDRASRFEQEGNHLHALQIYRQLLVEFPDEDFSVAALANLYEKMDKPELGIEMLQARLGADIDNHPLRLFAGHYFFRQDAWDTTIDYLSAFSTEEEPLIAFFVGYSNYMLKEYEIAKHHFLSYINLKGQSDFLQDAYIYLAKSFIHLNEFELALEYVKKAEDHFAEYYELYLLYAIIYYYMEMDYNSLDSINKAIKLNKTDPAVYEWGGKIAFRCGEIKKSVEYFRKYLDVGGEINADYYANFGMALLHNKKIDAAKANFELALQFEPEHENARRGLHLININYVAYER